MERKHVTQKELSARFEQERLFGEGVDLFKNYHAVLMIKNILSKIGVNTSKDTDWFRAVAQFLTMDEIKEVYDAIIKPSRRRAIAETSRHSIPELEEDDPDDILIFLSRNIVHRRKMWHLLEELFEKRAQEYKALLDDPAHHTSAVEKRFWEMKELFELSDLEMRALVVIFLSQVSFFDLGDFDVQRFRSGEKLSSLAKALGIIDEEASALLADDGNIRKYGLVDEDLDLDRTFLSYLSGISSKPLAERFWTKFNGEVLPWEFHGPLAEKHGAVLKEMIEARGKEAGISVLLYGVPGSGKTSFAASLAHDLGKKLYFIAQNDDDGRRISYSPAFRYAALAVAQKQLNPETSILVIDECDKLVENSGIGGGLLRFFGINTVGARDGETKGQLNAVMDSNRFTVLWICNSKQDAIDPSSRRRFDYNILFDELSNTAREHIWNNALKFHNCEGKLSDTFIKVISARYQVNPGGIAVAVKNAAALCAKDEKASFEEKVMVFLKAHCALLGITESHDEKLEPARDYSLDGLNIRSGIKLPRLIQVCQNFLKRSAKSIELNRDTPRMNLLLFGVPGSGKTEFVKYLAKQLNMKLNVKNASDLLNCYVGVTEQRIAQAFNETDPEKEILFIDEGDSMLSSREGAVRTFEVSQVNTLLTEMERFRGIFIVGTNMIQRLDQAALRRFSFRLHFDYLLNEGKEVFFNTYFTAPMGLPELKAEEKNALFAIENMVPSDFRNTRQQFFYLEDEGLSNSEIIEALATEVASRTSGANYKGLGNIVNKMGF